MFETNNNFHHTSTEKNFEVNFCRNICFCCSRAALKTGFWSETLVCRRCGGWTSRIKVLTDSESLRALFLRHSQRLLAVSSCSGKASERSGVSSVRALLPLVREPTSSPDHQPKAPPPNTVTQGLGFNTRILETQTLSLQHAVLTLKKSSQNRIATKENILVNDFSSVTGLSQ